MIFLDALLLKDTIPLIGAAVVVATFIIHRIIEHLSKRKEIERNWYMKVLVEPSISKVHDFFTSVILSYKDASAKLLTFSNTDEAQFSKTLSTEFGKFQEIKRAFEGSHILPIQIIYEDVANRITDHLLHLEDRFTSSLDSKLYSEDDLSDFTQFAYTTKARILFLLYSPVRIS
jgi:hypothetical protein